MNQLRSALVLIFVVLLVSGCSTLTKQDGLPSISQIDEWVANNQFGIALSSLEHISPNEKNFVAYVNKRKEVKNLASTYEKNIISIAQSDINNKNWSAAILSLNTALNNYPTSRLIHDQHNLVLAQQQKRINKLDAKALLARANLLYNKLPISKKEVVNSPISFTAKWDLQSLESELSDMNTRLLTMAGQLIDDNEIDLAEDCIQQARLLTTDEKSIASIESHQAKINYLNKIKHEKAAEIAYTEESRNKRIKQKNYRANIKRLINKVKSAIDNNQLILANKHLSKLAKLEPGNSDFLALQLKHRERVNRLVYKLTAQGDRLYRQEKISEAKEVWEKALRYDKTNKTLQARIRRANKVIKKLNELRNSNSAQQQ